MDFFAQPSFGTNAEAVADDQHADHQLRSNRGTARVAVVAGQMLAQLAQVKKVVDAAQQMILGNVALEIEGVEQAAPEPSLAAPSSPHPWHQHAISILYQDQASSRSFSNVRDFPVPKRRWSCAASSARIDVLQSEQEGKSWKRFLRSALISQRM